MKARSLYCYLAVQKLGYSATELAKQFGISTAVERGEKITKELDMKLAK